MRAVDSCQLSVVSCQLAVVSRRLAGARRLVFGIVLAVCAFAGACGGSAPQPDPIRPAEDSCASCRMQISQPKYAAEILAPDGQYLKFDDIGCFRFYLQANSNLQNAPCWVMDFENGQWVEARKAYYAIDTKEVTPMGSNILASSTSDRARAQAARVVTYEEMMAAGK
ncbi:MAG: nitrous oxide reductase accessory protein NosL [Acidobacteriota bacterium]